MINILLVIFSGMAGAVIGAIAVWIGILYQNKRWIFTPAIEIRTKSILSAYSDFLTAFFKINTAANVREKEVTFKENISQPIDDYLIAINKIDVWISEESSKKLRTILGVFRKFSHEIFTSKGKQPSLKVNDWTTFSESLGDMKTIVTKEIRSQDLRKFIFSVKIK
jgi:hypothetical protein